MALFATRLVAVAACLTAMTALPAKADKAAPRQTISITALNIEWFGQNSDSGRNPTAERRLQSIKQHFAQNDLYADVMIFEEIVDVTLLQRDLLGAAYECHSYQRSNRGHQHVVVCNKSIFEFAVADDADGYALNSVDVTGGLRPAVHGILKTNDGRRLAHIFGVHLKAMPDQNAVRMRQVNALVNYLETEQDDDPVIVMGDFNTFNDDHEKMEEAFGDTQVTELELLEPFTWATASDSYEPAKFDRIWLSRSLTPRVVSRRVVGPCSSDDLVMINAYNQAVSDHCAVHLKLAL